MSFLLKAEGNYSLSVKMNGQAIKGSPFSISAIPPPAAIEYYQIEDYSYHGHDHDNENNHDHSNNNNKSHSLSNSNGCNTDVLSWGGSGTKSSQFQTPFFLAVHPSDGRVFVTDSSNHRVQVTKPILFDI